MAMEIMEAEIMEAEKTRSRVKTERVSPNEIDAVALLAKCARAIRKNFKTLLLAFLTGAIIGTVFYMTAPKRYSSRMIIQSGVLAESYAARIAKDLTQLISEGNSLEASKKLGLTQAEASLIYSIDIENIKDTESKDKDKDKLEEKEFTNAFLVTAQVFDNAVLPQLQNGVLSLLSNNNYVKVREKLRRDYYIGMIAKVDRELNSLDSMKQSLFERKAKAFDVLLMDPTNIYKMAVELNKEKIGYQNKLELANTVHLVTGFTVYNMPSFPNMSFSLAGGAFLGVIVILVILGGMALMGALDEFSRKKLEQGVGA